MATNKIKWWQIFANDDEKRVFVGKDGTDGLVRSEKNYKWRTLASLVENSGLSKEKVEKILNKYIKAGLIFQNDRGDKFGYWENVAPHLGLPEAKSEVEQDQQSRIEKASKK